VSKETYYSVKRDLTYTYIYEHRLRDGLSTTVSKETYYSVKRDLTYTCIYEHRLRDSLSGSITLSGE
jgi:hypothetical protein